MGNDEVKGVFYIDAMSPSYDVTLKLESPHRTWKKGKWHSGTDNGTTPPI